MAAKGIDVVEEFFDAFLERDFERLAAVVAPDATWVIPGRSSIGGEHHGRDAVVRLCRDMYERCGGTLTTAGEDMAASEDHVFVNYRMTATREGRQLDSYETVVIHVREEMIGEGFVYLFDQGAFDEFWSV